MIDNRLARADATKLDELHEIMMAQENSERLCDIGIGGGTICDLCKYSTYYYNKENPLPLIIVQTALSVNAFSDNSRRLVPRKRPRRGEELPHSAVRYDPHPVRGAA